MFIKASIFTQVVFIKEQVEFIKASMLYGSTLWNASMFTQFEFMKSIDGYKPGNDQHKIKEINV